jgi:hypothetical protein
VQRQFVSALSAHGRCFPFVLNPNRIVVAAFEHCPGLGAVGSYPQDLIVRSYAVDPACSYGPVIEPNFDDLTYDREPFRLQVELIFH